MMIGTRADELENNIEMDLDALTVLGSLITHTLTGLVLLSMASKKSLLVLVRPSPSSVIVFP